MLETLKTLSTNLNTAAGILIIAWLLIDLYVAAMEGKTVVVLLLSLLMLFLLWLNLRSWPA